MSDAPAAPRKRKPTPRKPAAATALATTIGDVDRAVGTRRRPG